VPSDSMFWRFACKTYKDLSDLGPTPRPAHLINERDRRVKGRRGRLLSDDRHGQILGWNNTRCGKLSVLFPDREVSYGGEEL
jgi:hypothetical protein